MYRTRGLRRGVAAPTYALLLGFVALAGMAAMAIVGSQQANLSNDVAQAFTGQDEGLTSPSTPSTPSSDSNSDSDQGSASEAASGSSSNSDSSSDSDHGSARHRRREHDPKRHRQPKEEVLFAESFDRPSALDDWKGVEGDLWDVRDGNLVNRPQKDWKPEQRLFAPGGPWQDQAVELEVTLNSGWGYGVFVRAELDKKDRPTGVCFQYDPGYQPGAFLFRDVNNGNETSAKAVAWVPDFDFFGEPHRIRVEAIGDNYTAYVDGKKVLEYSTPHFKEGTVGLRTWGHGSGEVVVHDLKVVAPRQGTEAGEKKNKQYKKEKKEKKEENEKKEGRHV